MDSQQTSEAFCPFGHFSAQFTCSFVQIFISMLLPHMANYCYSTQKEKSVIGLLDIFTEMTIFSRKLVNIFQHFRRLKCEWWTEGERAGYKNAKRNVQINVKVYTIELNEGKNSLRLVRSLSLLFSLLLFKCCSFIVRLFLPLYGRGTLKMQSQAHTQSYQNIIRVLTYLYHLCITFGTTRELPPFGHTNEYFHIMYFHIQPKISNKKLSSLSLRGF